MSHMRAPLDVIEQWSFCRGFDGVLLSLGFIILTIGLCNHWRKGRSKKLPPGPTGLPLLGYLPFMQKDPVKAIERLVKKYGNIVGLYLGSQYVVFLNDWEAAKDAFGQNATLNKPSIAFAQAPYKLGVAGANGQEWVESRRFFSKVMKDGLRKNNWEDLIQEEVFETVKVLAQNDGKPIDIREFFSESLSSDTMSLILGERSCVGNSDIKMITDMANWIIASADNFILANFSPRLAKFMQMLGLEEVPKEGENVSRFAAFWSETVDSKIQNYKPNTMITRFYEEVNNPKSTKPHSSLTDGTVNGSIMTVVTGISETTRTAFIWLLIAAAEHPDKQRRVHEELDRVTARDVSIRWADRYKIPYTFATILESQRWKTSVPFPLMRITNEDTQIQGYDIPKGTHVMTSNCLLHGDERYWENPDQFIPERFLLDDGKKVNMSPDSYNPFSYGKRDCPGKILAQMELLQYFCSIMQKFEVRPKEGNKVHYKGVLELTYQAKEAELRFIPR